MTKDVWPIKNGMILNGLLGEKTGQRKSMTYGPPIEVVFGMHGYF